MFGANTFGQAYFGQPAAGSTGLAATTTVGFSTAAALSAPTPFAAAATIRVSSTATFASAAFASVAQISWYGGAALTAPFKLAAAATIQFSTQATFAVARFATLPHLHFETTATLTTGVDYSTKTRILLAGQDARTRIAGLTIRDVLNDAPNTCALTIDGTEAPACEQSLRVLLDADAPKLLFNGALQTVSLSYEGLPGQIVYPCTAIDDTARANRLRPFGSWTNVSATLVARQILSVFAPGFTTKHVQDTLPPVTVLLDGTEGMSGALTQIAKLIGGYYYFEDTDLHLFQDEATTPPDPIDGTPGRLLDDPPITITRDDSQLRTRQYGRGHGETLLADVDPGDSILPVANADAWFGTLGPGLIIVGSQRLAYTGVRAGGAGSLVGPGASPSTAPTLALINGNGLGNGVYQYGYTDVTPVGESRPSPIAAIFVGALAPPGAPSVAGPSVGTGPDDGAHDYAMTFVTAAGETTPGPISNAIVTSSTPGTPIQPPSSPSATDQPTSPSGHNVWNVGDSILYVCTYMASGGGETTAGPGSNTIVGAPPGSGGGVRTIFVNVPPYAGGAVGMWCYRRINGVFRDAQFVSSSAGGNLADNGFNFGSFRLPPASNTTAGPGTPNRQITVGLPIGASGLITNKRLYRRSGGSGLRLVTTLANNTTSYLDTTLNANLGGGPPGSNTAVANQVALSGIAVGAGPTNARKLYRTVAGGSQLQLLTTIADNSTTTYTDALPDGVLGAAPPIGDTSGLTQPGGQVNAGSTTLPTASAAPFMPTYPGGWAMLTGGQVIRYFGISGNNLTGIPAVGPGSLGTTVLYGAQVFPAPSLLGVTGPLIHAPATPLSVTIVPGGPLFIGTYRYCYTFVSAAGETLPSPATVVVTTPAQLATVVAAPPLGPAGTLSRRLYRTKVDGAIFYWHSGFGPADVSQILDTTVDSAMNLGVSPPTADTAALRDKSALAQGTPVNIWVQRDDLAAQAEQAAIDAANGIVPADGIYEGPPLVDERRNETSMRALCDASLEMYSRPIVTVTYACRDVKTKSGKTIVIDLTSPQIHETLTIQEVTITEIDIAPGLLPRFSVVASSVRFSLDDILRRLLTATDASA